MRRVVITGVGIASCFGSDVPAFWDALRHGRSGVRALNGLPGVPANSPYKVAAPVTGFAASSLIDPKSLRLMAPAVAYGVGAAELAVRDSGIQANGQTLDPTRFGAFIGSRGHSSDRHDLLPAVELASPTGAFELRRFGAEGLPRVPPMWLLKGLANNVLYFVSLRHNAQGMNDNMSLGGSASTVAIGEAFEAIRRGYVDAAIAGGYESGIDLDRIEMFQNTALATRTADPAGAGRPFDRRRDGFVLGEGGGMLVLEALDAARARDARIYGEVLGYGAASAPQPLGSIGPSAQGYAGALTAALKQAGLAPDAVFALGLATDSDVAETSAIKKTLGAAAGRTPAPALKSMIGNTIAASGALEVTAALGALAGGWLPPTINLSDPDPACDLDYVAGTEGRPARLKAVAVCNANLGGGHAALLLGRFA